VVPANAISAMQEDKINHQQDHSYSMPSSLKQEDGRIWQDRNLQIIFAITLMAVMGVASITPAFPKIIKELRIPPHNIGLLITAFTVPGVFLTPVLGVLADRFGRKRILAPSLFLFALAGGACAFSQNFHALLILRFLQGIGAAALGSLNATLIGDLYVGSELGAAMGWNASVLSLGTASYPALGGVLAAAGWQYPFLLPLLAIPVGLLVLFVLQNPEPKNSQPLSGYLRGIWKVLHNRQVAGLFIATLAIFIILYGSYLTYLPLLLNHSFKASSVVIGLIMSGMSCTMALTAAQMGRLTKIYAKKTLIQAAFVFYALSLLLIPCVSQLWLLLLPIALFGAAMGINVPCLQTMLAGLAPLEYRGAFMSVNGMVLRLGQTLGPLLMGAVFAGYGGINGVFYAGAACSLLMVLAIAALL
jgi:MFS family permease